MSDDEPTWPGQHYPDTVPTLRGPPPRGPWWSRWWAWFRENMGPVGALVVAGVVLAGIACAAVLIPAVRHGVSKIVTHHGTSHGTGQSVSPSLRDGSPSLAPASRIHGSTSGPRVSRSAKPAASPSNARVTAQPTVTSVRPSSPAPTPRPTPTRTPKPTPTPTPTPSTTSPTPTPSTPSPVPSTSSATTPAPAVTTAVPASES